MMPPPRIVFCISVSLAILIVILLALVSPLPRKNSLDKHSRPLLALSLYIQQPHISNSDSNHPVTPSETGAFIFHRVLTEGPEKSSKIVGKAQGFIIPVQQFAQSAFNVIYLTFDTPEYSGSLSVHAKQIANDDEGEELTVMGGTASFAFARGLAVFAKTSGETFDSTYQVKLQHSFPNQSRKIPRWSFNLQGLIFLSLL